MDQEAQLQRLAENAHRNEPVNVTPEISYGTILTICATLLISVVGAIGVYFLFVIRQDKNLSLLTYQVGKLTEEIAGMKDLMKTQIEQNTRITLIEHTIYEMKHGEGYVLPLGGRNKSAFGEGS